jgi:hypothetical protein
MDAAVWNNTNIFVLPPIVIFNNDIVNLIREKDK